MTLDQVDPVLGAVRFCRGCGETWPIDDEFWYFKPGTDKVLGRCKACWAERVRDPQTGHAVFTTPLLPVPA